MLTDPLFSVNRYDHEGDMTQLGVHIHMGPFTLEFKDSAELEKFANKLLRMLPEIRENEDLFN